MRLSLRLLALAAAIGSLVVVVLDHQALAQSLQPAALASPHPVIKHSHLVRTLQPSDLPEILNIYDRDEIRALAAQPGLAQAYLSCAAQDIADGHYENAIRKVVNARVLAPEIPNASTILAQALNGLRRYEDTYLLLSGLHSPEVDSWQAIYERARAEVGIGNLQGADTWSLRAVAAAPSTFAQAHLVRGQALMLAERWQEARTELNLYLKLTSDPTRHPEALEALNTLSRIAPDTRGPVPR
jgi:tetratricopeptide (TPR) repeat protein